MGNFITTVAYHLEGRGLIVHVREGFVGERLRIYLYDIWKKGVGLFFIELWRWEAGLGWVRSEWNAFFDFFF